MAVLGNVMWPLRDFRGMNGSEVSFLLNGVKHRCEFQMKSGGTVRMGYDPAMVQNLHLHNALWSMLGFLGSSFSETQLSRQSSQHVAPENPSCCQDTAIGGVCDAYAGYWVVGDQ